MRKLFKEWRRYLTSVKINEAQTVTLPRARVTNPDLGTPGERPDPLRWRDHLKRQYPEEYKKLNDELRRRLSKGPGLGPGTGHQSAATKSKLIKNNIIDYWHNAMRGLETGTPIKPPKPAPGKPFKPWPSPEDLPSGRPPPSTQSPSGRPGGRVVYDYPAAVMGPEGKAVPPEGFKEPFPKKPPGPPKTSVLKSLGPSGAALATVDGVDSLAGPELRKAIATLAGSSEEEVAQIPTPNLKQRLKTLVSTYTAPFEMGAEFLRKKLFSTEEEAEQARRKAGFEQRIKDAEAAERWAELAGYKLTGGDVSGIVTGKKKP